MRGSRVSHIAVVDRRIPIQDDRTTLGAQLPRLNLGQLWSI